ncbi:MAG: M23 family metallopeptidase [Caulobacteraceae bacterium]|nr:M23 family metallopeptidase [Caulobacteraceae bacterium]
MAQFDPRRQPLRFAPHILTGVAALAVTALIWRVYEPAQAVEVPPLDPTAVAALEQRAFVAAETRPGLDLPETVPVRVRGGETIEDAVQRLGVTEAEARAAARSLARAGVANAPSFQAAIANPSSGRGSPRLIGLTLRNGPASTMMVARTFDGALRLRELQEKVTAETMVAIGEVDNSFGSAAAAAGASRGLAEQARRLFSTKIDFNRDVGADNRFALVFDREVTESGRTIRTGGLLYAEVETKHGPVRFYRFERNGKVEYFDANGQNTRNTGLVLPIPGARMTSTFGWRVHPVLHFRKMHTGVDYGAAYGTPIRAPGDGVVVEARRAGGYGNWIRVRLGGGLDVGFGHMSRYAPGMRPGVRVKQGQVIGYVGSTGMSTGPHLHYEAFRNGQRINPAGLRLTQTNTLAGADLQRFRAEKARIDALVAKRKAQPEPQEAAPLQTASADGLRAASLTRGR